MQGLKEKLIQEIHETDENERAIYVISVLKDFTCEFCPDRKYKRVFTDASLNSDLCGYHADIINKMRVVGLNNAELREHMPILEQMHPRR